MKKVITLLLIVTLAFALISCSASNDNAQDKQEFFENLAQTQDDEPYVYYSSNLQSQEDTVQPQDDTVQFQDDTSGNAQLQEYVTNDFNGYKESQNSSIVLPVVAFPPSERMECPNCHGTQKTDCIRCNGSGQSGRKIENTDVYESFGLGGLANTLSNLPCILCDGTGETACGLGYCDGTAVNPEYRQYCLGLKELSDATGVRIFELESNQQSPYIGLDFCTMCDGLGWLPQLKVHETHTPLCSKCYTQGMKLEFLDSFTEEELTRSYDNYLAYHPTPGQYSSGGSSYSSGSSSESWYEAPGDAVWTPGSSDGRGTIDLGAQSTGNCPGCGAKVYTSDTYCAFCR